MAVSAGAKAINESSQSPIGCFLRLGQFPLGLGQFPLGVSQFLLRRGQFSQLRFGFNEHPHPLLHQLSYRSDAGFGLCLRP